MSSKGKLLVVEHYSLDHRVFLAMLPNEPFSWLRPVSGVAS